MKPSVWAQLESKAKEKREVLSQNLKVSGVRAVLIWMWKLFHTFGAATEKARAPRFLSLDRGTSRIIWLDNLSALAGVCTYKSSNKKGDANPFKTLKTSNKILKTILKQTGSQWREAKTRVMCSRFLVPVRSRAAAFWTNCNRRREDWSNPT